MALPVPHRRFTVSEYHQMAEAGILKREDRVELISGEVIEMSPISPLHAAAVDRINRLLHQRVDASVMVRVQNPIQLDEHSEPQPDLALAVARADFYAHGHPTPAEVWLTVEVAESSLVRDRMIKAPAYASALISELWIVNLQEDVVEVYTQPANGSYQSIRQAGRGETLSPQALPDLVLQAEELLG